MRIKTVLNHVSLYFHHSSCRYCLPILAAYIKSFLYPSHSGNWIGIIYQIRTYDVRLLDVIAIQLCALLVPSTWPWQPDRMLVVLCNLFYNTG